MTTTPKTVAEVERLGADALGRYLYSICKAAESAGMSVEHLLSSDADSDIEYQLRTLISLDDFRSLQALLEELER